MATSAAAAGQLTAVDVVDPVGSETAGDDVSTVSCEETSTVSTPGRRRRLVVAFVLLALIAAAAAVGWLSYQAHVNTSAQHQRELFLQVGKQGAINLTTIDWQHADRDVNRILDSSTGSFHDEFSSRAAPFIDVVKQSQSITVGTATEAGIESEADGSAQVLVAVTVKTSNAAAPVQESRSWRMRVGVERDGDEVKVSNVEFVP